MTGLDYEACRAALATVTGKARVMGVNNRSLAEALRLLVPGATFARFRYYYPRWRPTFAQFLARTREERDPGAFYLVIVTSHYLVVRGRKVWDNSTPAEGTYLSKGPCRRARVRSVYALVPPS